MSRWGGRLITQNPVVPSGAAPTSSAPGIWTLAEVAYWNRQGRWPSAGADPYWSYVSYLLGTTSTNAAQNNTFLDSSTNNFTITRNGNTTQGSFTPYGMFWSNFFDGSGDYLTSSGSTASTVGSGDFSVEAFVFWTSYPTQYTSIFSTRSTNNANAAAFTVGVESSGYVYAFSNAFIAQTASGVFALNTWNHVVFTRSGTTARLFVNGVLRATGTNSQNFSDQGFAVAANRDGTEPGAGYVSNLRLVKGSIPTDYQTSSTTVGTTIFTPPTGVLTAISGTGILTCQSNRFIDNSGNALTITKNGDTVVSAFSPFILGSPGYDAGIVAGSGYFDGSGDYLSLADSAALQMGSDDFTVDFWWYPSSVSGYQTPYEKGYTGAGGLLLQTGNGDGKIIVYASGSAVITATTAVAVGAWNHMALVRSGTSMVLYLNGTSVGSATNSTNFNSTGSAGIGANVFGGGAGAYPINGYISNFRIVKGTAVYTSAFTPPTAPVTAITNTSLLLNFTNAGIYNASMNSDMETVGSAQVSTGQAKFGTTSVAFSGNSDYLIMPSSPALTFGTGDFTVEGWFYITSYSGGPLLFDARPSSTNGAYPAINVDPAGVMGYYVNSAYQIFGATTVSLNAWNHFALARSGSSTKLFLNGTQQGSTYTDTNNYLLGANRPIIGGNGFAPGTASGVNGYIDDLRITKGYARYTANFTPPTAALPVY